MKIVEMIKESVAKSNSYEVKDNIVNCITLLDRFTTRLVFKSPIDMQDFALHKFESSILNTNAFDCLIINEETGVCSLEVSKDAEIVDKDHVKLRVVLHNKNRSSYEIINMSKVEDIYYTSESDTVFKLSFVLAAIKKNNTKEEIIKKQTMDQKANELSLKLRKATKELEEKIVDKMWHCSNKGGLDMEPTSDLILQSKHFPNTCNTFDKVANEFNERKRKAGVLDTAVTKDNERVVYLNETINGLYKNVLRLYLDLDISNNGQLEYFMAEYENAFHVSDDDYTIITDHECSTVFRTLVFKIKVQCTTTGISLHRTFTLDLDYYE